MKLTKRSCLAFAAGALTPLAFAPVGFFPLAVLCPALLLWLWFDQSPKQALWLGWLYGIGFFGIGVSWVYISIHEFGNTPMLLAGLFTTLFVLFLALFPAIQGYILARWLPNRHLTTLLLAFPAVWIAFEWIRSSLMTGFPWILLAYSQVFSPLNGLVPLVGEWGTGFAVLLSSGLLVALCNAKALSKNNLPFFRSLNSLRSDNSRCKTANYSLTEPKKIRPYVLLASLILLWVAAGLLGQIRWTTPAGEPLTVVLTQGNIPQALKWDAAYVNRTLETYLEMTREHWGADIIVWPESAIPLPVHQAKGFIEELSQAAQKHGTAMLIGIPVQLPDGNYQNGFHGLGEGEGSYLKRRLVPFGEYVPLDKYLRGAIAFLDIPMSNFVSGGDNQKNLFVHGIPIAPFICYEIAYAYIVRQHLPQAQLLVTISNVTWFGDSLAPWQHLEMGQFRALQTGRYHLFDGNAGVTAIIDDRGRVQSRIPQFKTAALEGVVQPMIGETPWVRWGDKPFLGCLVLLLIVLFFKRKKPK